MLLSPRPEPVGAPVRRGRRPIPPIPGLAPLAPLVCLEELPGSLGRVLFRSAADVALWSECEFAHRRGLFWPGQPETAQDPPPALRPALAALAHVARQPEAARPAHVSQACSAIGEWAQDAGHVSTALMFAELAATADPDDPVPAVAAGRALRNASRYDRARRWLDRAERVAHVAGDHQTRADAFLALGVLEERQGKLRRAMRLMARSYRLAAKAGFTDVAAHARTNALGICGLTGRFAEAQAHAEAAITLYGPGHSQIPSLAQDIAHLWSLQGHYDVALPVLQAALAAITEPDQRYITTANVARAAAGAGDRALFLSMWQDLDQQDGPRAHRFSADALVGLGEGALMLGFSVAARDLGAKALAIARKRGDVLAGQDAEDLLTRVPEGLPVARWEPPTDRERLLAGRLTRMLKDAAPD